MNSKFSREPQGRDFLREDGSFVPVNTQKPVNIGGTVVGPDLSLRSGYTGITEAARLQSRERGGLSLRRMIVFGTAIVGAAAGLTLAMTEGDGENVPKPASVTTERDQDITSGTVSTIVAEGDGWREVVLAEANNSGKVLSEEQLDAVVEEGQELNPGDYGPKQPRFGEELIVPNIVGPVGIDQTPPTSEAPVAPTPAP